MRKAPPVGNYRSEAEKPCNCFKLKTIPNKVKVTMLEMVDRVGSKQLADMARPSIPPMRRSYRLCRALNGASNKHLIFYYTCLNNLFKIRLIFL
jgi:hypothetical protein